MGTAPAASVCSTTHVYHYLLDRSVRPEAVLAGGLLPLSEQARLDDASVAFRLQFYRLLYEGMVAPALGRPYSNSGVYLTPIDFRRLEGHAMAGLARVRVPLEALAPDSAIITWMEGEDERIVRRLAPEALAEAAAGWPAERVRQWFGRNPRMIFFHVPQVAAYQARIPVEAAWLEAPAEGGKA